LQLKSKGLSAQQNQHFVYEPNFDQTFEKFVLIKLMFKELFLLKLFVLVKLFLKGLKVVLFC